MERTFSEKEEVDNDGVHWELLCEMRRASLRALNGKSSGECVLGRNARLTLVGGRQQSAQL